MSSQSEHDRQVQQMIAFLKAEAQEKADEIRQKANAEYETQFQEMKRAVEYVHVLFAAPSRTSMLRKKCRNTLS